MPDSLTPGQVSELLDIPASTLRRYVADFGGFLSLSARRSRRREYTPADVATIGEIRTLAAQGLTVDEIRDRLEQTIDVSAAESERDTSALALPGLVAGFEALRDRLQAIADEQEQTRERVSATNADVEALQDRLEQLERELERERLPWYKRLFRRGE